MATAELTIRFEGDSRDAEAALRRINAALGTVGPAADKQTGLVGRLTNSLGKIGLAGIGIEKIAAAIGGILTHGPIGAASDLSESINKLNVVLGESADEVMAWAETSAQAFGQSKQQAIAAAGTFSNLFVSMGKGQKEAADLSTNIVELASDLASFNNISTDEALEKLRAGLVGETEPLRALGVNINAAAVEAEGLALGIVGVGEEMTDAQKITARYSLIMKQTATAQGDFAETSTGLANSQRIISASFEDIQAQIGERLLPLIAPLVSAFATSLPAAMTTLAGVLDSVGAAFGTVSGAVSDLLGYFSAGNDVDLMGKLFGPDIGPIIDEAVRGLQSVADVVGRVVELGGLLVGGKINLSEFFGSLGAALSRIDMPDFGAILGNVGDIISGLATTLGEAVAGIPWGAIWSKAKDVGAGLLGSLGSIVADVQAWVGQQFDGIVWGDVWQGAVNIGAGLLSGLGSIVADIQTWVGDQFDGINWDGIWSDAVDLGSGLVSGLGSIGGDILQWVKDQWAFLDGKWPEIWASAGNIVMGLLASVSDFGGSVVTWITEAWAFLKDAWPGIWDKAGDVVGGLLTSVGDFGADVLLWVQDAWAKLSTEWPKIWGDAGDIVGGLIKSVTDIADRVEAWLVDTWGKIGWDKVWAEATGFAAGLQPLIEQAFRDAWAGVRTTAEGEEPIMLPPIVASSQPPPPPPQFLSREWAAQFRQDVAGLAVVINDELAKLGGLLDFASLLKRAGDVSKEFGASVTAGILDWNWGEIVDGLLARFAQMFTIALPALGLGVLILDAIGGFFVGAFGELWSRIEEPITTALDGVANGILNGITLGLLGGAPQLVEAFVGLITAGVAAVRAFLGIESPSTVFIAIGQDIVNGLIAGVAGLAAAVAAAVGSIPTAIAGAAGTVLSGALILGQNIVSGLTTGAAGLLAALGVLLGQITGWVTSTAATILTSAAAIGASIVNGLRAGAEILTAKLGEIWATIDGWITQTAATILGSAAAIGRDLASGIRNGANTITAKLGEVWATIDGWISETAGNVLATAAGIGRNLAQGVINGIDELIGQAKAKAEEIGNIITGALSAITGEHSPSTVTRETGRNIGRGLVVGMESSMREVVAASTALGKSALEGIDAAVGSGLGRLGGSEIAWANPSGVSAPLPAMASNDSQYWGARPAGGGQSGQTVVNNYNATINTQATHVDIPTEFSLTLARHGGRY